MEEKEIQEITEKKQKYLRDEILSQNYDADEFSEFISQYKENGLDLSSWTFDELKDVVQKFKNKNKVEDDEKSIEKGVENIRNSYIINRIEDLITKPDNNNNLANKNNDSNNNNNINNNNNCLEFDVIDYVDDKGTNEKNKIRIMNSSIRIAELDLENEGINNIVNIQKLPDKPNDGNQNINKDNRVEIIENNNKNVGETMELIQNNNININENNNIMQNTNEKKSLYDDFEIWDNPYINNNNNVNNIYNNNPNNIYNNNPNNIYDNNPNNIYDNNPNNIYDNNPNTIDNNNPYNVYNNNPNNIYDKNGNNIYQNSNDMMQLKLKCVKQPENSLTNNNNLYVNLEM